MPELSIYATGGTVQAAGGLYLERAADRRLLELCRAGAFAFVLTARQMGKSSLMVRTAERLVEEGAHPVLIDLTELGSQSTAEQWYRGVLLAIEDQLELRTRAADWWQTQADLGVAHRLNLFLREVVLREVSGRVVIFIDEIDTTLRLDFTDDFFAAIRFLYNARANAPELQRLSFVLIGVARPGDLIKDAERTPFNIGQRVDLSDFSAEEARPLLAGLDLPQYRCDEVLGAVLAWTGGHPYLTLRVFRSLQDRPPEAWTANDIHRRVGELFFGEARERDSNLQFVRDMLTKKAQDLEKVLTVYREIRRGRKVEDNELDLTRSWLKLAGVAVARGSRLLQVRNRIYETVFTEEWVRAHLPVDWRKRAAMFLKWAVALLIVCAAGLAPYAVLQQRRAEAQRDLATARGLAAQASLLLSTDPGATSRSVLLAVASLTRAATPEGDQSLRSSLGLLRKQVAAWNLGAAVWSVAFSPDGRRLAAGGAGGNVHLLAMDGRGRVALLAHQEPVRSIAFRVNSLWLAAASGKTVRLWDGDTAREIGRLEHGDTVAQVAFSPDGRRLATASADGTARLWDAETRRLLATLRHPSAVLSVAFSRDGSRLVTGCRDEQARLWEGAREVLRLSHRAPVWAVAFSAAGSGIATGAEDGTVQVWDAVTLFGLHGQVRGHERRPLMHQGTVYAVSFSPDGRTILTAGLDRTARLWDPATGRELARLSHDAGVNTAAFAPDGRWLASGSDDGFVRLWELRNPEPLPPLGHGDIVRSVAFSPDGRRVVTGGDDRTARVWEVDSGTEVLRVPHPSAVSLVDFVFDEHRILTVSEDNAVRVWEVPSGKELARFDHEDIVSWAAASRDGRFVVTSVDRRVRLWDVAARRVRTEVGHEDPVYAVAISPDGRQILTGSLDATARVWDAESGKQLAELKHPASVLSVAFRPDGRQLATGGEDGLVRLWDAGSFREAARLPHQDPVDGLAFSRDGRQLVTRSLRRVRIWDVETRRESLAIGFPDDLRAVALSPDGRWLGAAVGPLVQFSPLSPGELARLACELLPRNLSREEWNAHLPGEPYRPTCPGRPIPGESPAPR